MLPESSQAVPDNPFLATFRPYIPAQTHIRELTALPLIVGTLLGMVFGASSLYLVLKVGLTVSASIPVAVISISLFRLLGKIGVRDATILENNIVQTAGSAGESIAFGVGVTMPAIMILGFDLEFTRVMLVAMLGGLLGILMMIPLRRALIVQQHGLLEISRRHGLRGSFESRCVRRIARGGRSCLQGQSRGSRTKPRRAPKQSSPVSASASSIRSCMAAFQGLERSSAESFRRAFQGGSVAAEISRRCWVSATSSVHASLRSCVPAVCWPIWC